MTNSEEADSSAATQLLLAWGTGDREALDQMLPLVYEELHRLAAHYLSRERPDHTLQPTGCLRVREADSQRRGRHHIITSSATSRVPALRQQDCV